MPHCTAIRWKSCVMKRRRQRRSRNWRRPSMHATSIINCDLPDTTTLAAGLRSLDGPGAAALGQCGIVDRQRNIYTSTFPAEAVTCRLQDGRLIRVLCKYSGGVEKISHGHRGGVAYESAVYRHVLQPARAQVPRFFGTHRDPQSGWEWLVLEYLDGSERMTWADDCLTQSVCWLARFHGQGQAILRGAEYSFLNTY